MRFSLDETYDKREIFMVGVRRYIAACVLCILLVGVNQCFSIIETLTLYPQFFVLYFVTSLMSDVLNKYARGIVKISKLYSKTALWIPISVGAFKNFCETDFL